MKHVALAIAMLVWLEAVAADAPQPLSSSQQLARQVITAFQTGRGSVIQSNVTAYLPVLEKGVKDFPQDPLMYFALGICDMGQENKQRAAIEAMDKAYRLSQKDAGIGVLYALALKMNKQPMKAYELDKEMVAAHPRTPQLEIQLAVLDLTIQKYDEAMTILSSLEQNAPANLPSKDRSALLLMLGTCHLYKGNHQRAIETLERSLSITPNMATDLMVLGEACLKCGDLEKANRHLDAALSINPKIPSALYYRGICFGKAGNHERAQKAFEDAYKYGKQRLNDNGEDYYLMFLISQKLNKGAEAEGYRAEAKKLGFTYEAPWK